LDGQLYELAPLPPHPNSTGSWVCPRVGLDVGAVPATNQPSFLAVQSTARRYTD
jgi:hypothetical protein